MKVVCLCVVALLLSLMAPASAAAPLDTEAWGRVLSRHVREGRVDYVGLKNDLAARKDMLTFLRAIGAMRDDEPLASWLNAYNALLMSAALARYPVRSVRDVSGFFEGQRHRVAGQLRTLDELEQLVIMDRFKDSRVHAALCYASLSGARLMNEPFKQETLDATLTRLSKELVANPDHMSVHDGQVALSSLFFWFRDFAHDAGSIVGWVRKYAPAGTTIAPTAEPTEINFDWRLNEAASAAPVAPAPTPPAVAPTPPVPATPVP